MINLQGEALRSLASGAAFVPKEEMLEIGRKHERLYIGMPKESAFQERRVALVPEAVGLLVANGHRVVVESGAGDHANFSDNDYSEVGGEIAYDTKEVYQASLIFKISPPSNEDIDLMKYNQIIFSSLQLTVQPKSTLQKLMEKRITAVAWDYIKNEIGVFPTIRSMGEIAGNTSILVAAEVLSNANNGKGLMLGGVAGVPPTEVVIIGAGTVGEYAARAALGLGASVKIFDSSIYKLRRIQHSLKMPVFTSIIQPRILRKALMRSDVAIGALRASFGRTPCVVSENMVENMKSHSVIIDISIDQGGCFETSQITTHDSPTFTKHDVVHYCVPNIASRVSRTASFALSNIFSPLLLDMGTKGGCEGLIKDNEGFRHGVYVYKGKLTSSYLGETFNIPYKDINLLLAAF